MFYENDASFNPAEKGDMKAEVEACGGRLVKIALIKDGKDVPPCF